MRPTRTTKHLPLLLAVAALALGACGSDDDDTESDAPAGTTGSAGSPIVSVESIDGVGDVLVDQSGMALYFADGESDSEVLCVDDCAAVWVPLAAEDSTPAAEDGGPELGVVTRPDGTDQVTADGKPLYTFAQDAPGEVTGDGISDSFGDQPFTWHVALADEAGATPSTSTEDDGADPYGY